MLLFDYKSRRNLKRDFHATVINSLPLTRLCQLPNRGEISLKVTFCPFETQPGVPPSEPIWKESYVCKNTFGACIGGPALE